MKAWTKYTVSALSLSFLFLILGIVFFPFWLLIPLTLLSIVFFPIFAWLNPEYLKKHGY